MIITQQAEIDRLNFGLQAIPVDSNGRPYSFLESYSKYTNREKALGRAYRPEEVIFSNAQWEVLRDGTMVCPERAYAITCAEMEGWAYLDIIEKVWVKKESFKNAWKVASAIANENGWIV